MPQPDLDQLMHDYYRSEDDRVPARLAVRVDAIPETESVPSITPQGWRQRLGRWLVRDAGDMASAGIRGRSRPTDDGRHRLMITATGTLAAVAVLMLGVAVVNDDSQAPANVTGTETAIAVPADWAFFSGELRYDGKLPASGTGSRERTENGLTAFSSTIGYTDQSFTTTDDRLTGKHSELATTLLSDDDDGSVIWMRRSLIENENGAWTCLLSKVSHPAMEAPDGAPLSGWCDGSGAYDGQRAYLAMAIPGFGGVGGERFDVSGFVSSAEGPLLLPND